MLPEELLMDLDVKAFGKVAVLMGGWSAERAVSLQSGQAVLDGLKRAGVDAWGVDVQKATVLDTLRRGSFDRAFIILHGPGGEDGVIQGALDILNIPYTGSGVLASALSMDKLRCKQFFEGAGIPTPPYRRLDEGSDMALLSSSLGLPLMIKPALEGSSLGMSKVERVEELLPAWQQAAQYQGAVIAERWIEGAEYTVAILGQQALPVIRLETSNTFYDYAAKYQSDETRYHCPCGLSQTDEKRLQDLALSAFNAVGASGWGRVDVMCDEEGTPWVIEINSVPGMTSHSLVPMAAKAAGMNFDELVCRILAQTLECAQIQATVGTVTHGG
ncbi:D-alanine--D-alanine ligase [hydrothermal vent metagenome]|uniref:D-alanine--D-alanine ligase n=1 Tax=hydrothermal vent metagenome TaxID=652676 RepID=A0A3B1BZW4_9ZZZZ